MEASFSAGAICSRETARAAPGIALSKREQQVLHWAAEGSEWGIGLILGLSEHTVEKFIQSARIKLPRCEANACRGQAVRLRLVASDPPLTRSCRDQKKAGGRSICINCGGTPLQFMGSGLPNKTRYAMRTLRSSSRCAFLPALPDKSSSGQQMRG